jgi:hypothetical protein
LLVLAVGCSPEPEEPNAFMTNTYTSMPPDSGMETGTDSNSTDVPDDMPAGDGDGDPATGDGDGDPTTTGDGDGDPTTTTGDGDGDPTTTGDGDGDPTTTGDPVCGNGVIDDGEQCDGGNLGGFTCVDLGYSGGTLACDPVTCTYDASGCVSDPDGGGTTG